MSLQAQAQAQRSARYSPQETIKVRENYIYVHFSFETGRLIFLFFFYEDTSSDEESWISISFVFISRIFLPLVR